jgi:hypothetical protein
MKLNPQELQHVQRLVVASEKSTSDREVAGDRDLPLSLAALVAQRKRLLDSRIG